MSKARRSVRGILAHMWCKRIIPNQRKKISARTQAKAHHFFQEE
jgi:hypothetical protein